jgi:hypothetical protein
MPAVNPAEENWRRNCLSSAIMRGMCCFVQRENLMIFVRITMNVLPDNSQQAVDKAGEIARSVKGI